MSVDLTREFHRIDEEIHRRVDIVGESVQWFEFLSLESGGSTYDDIYDEGVPGDGGRSYAAPKTVETIYAEEIEDESRAMEDGRQPTQNVRLTIRLTDAENAGLNVAGEYQPHLNDLFLYDHRYYEVYKYRVRGRMEGEEVLLLVDGVETYLDQEFTFDPGPVYDGREEPWPSFLPDTSMVFTPQSSDGLFVQTVPEESIAVSLTDDKDTTYIAAVNLSAQRAVVLTATGIDYYDQTDPSQAGRLLGITTTAALAGTDVSVIVDGIWSGASGLTPGAIYANGSDGSIGSTRPTSGVLQLIGYASNANTLAVSISEPSTL